MRVVSIVQPSIIRFFCEKCHLEKNEMNEVVMTGNVLQMNPPRFEYKCPVCGEKMHSWEKFPSITFDIIEGTKSIGMFSKDGKTVETIEIDTPPPHKKEKTIIKEP